MPNGFASRGGWGFGFQGTSPPWPYVGRGRGGLPRCSYFLRGAAGVPGGFAYWTGPYSRYSTVAPFAPRATQEQEIDLLKAQAQALESQLEQIEARIRDLKERENK